jgi:hypothetical protein
MVAFAYRMPAFVAPGEVNRAHPFWEEAAKGMPSNPPTLTGQPVVVDRASGGMRPLGAGDTAVTTIWGVTTRAYPTQPTAAFGAYGSQPLGGAALPSVQVFDVLRQGYIGIAVNGSPAKGDPVFIWIAASAAPHVQGGFEAVAGGANTIQIAGLTFNGPPDANGLCELIIGP